MTRLLVNVPLIKVRRHDNDSTYLGLQRYFFASKFLKIFKNHSILKIEGFSIRF